MFPSHDPTRGILNEKDLIFATQQTIPVMPLLNNDNDSRSINANGIAVHSAEEYKEQINKNGDVQVSRLYANYPNVVIQLQSGVTQVSPPSELFTNQLGQTYDELKLRFKYR